MSLMSTVLADRFFTVALPGKPIIKQKEKETLGGILVQDYHEVIKINEL